jgi:hypothetical protein
MPPNPRAAEPSQAIPQSQLYSFPLDNTNGQFKLPHTVQPLTWPGATEDEAYKGLSEWLNTQRTPQGFAGSPTAVNIQHGLETVAPPMAGALGGLNPLTSGAARAGAYLATRGTQALLDPEAYQEQTAGNWGNVAGEALAQGGEGAIASWLSRPAGQFLTGPLRNKIFTGTAAGPELTPTQERLYSEGTPGTPPTYEPGASPGGPPTPGTPAVPPGPFAAGAELTGEQAYPRLSQVYQNWFTGLSDRFATAFLARGRTRDMNTQVRTNLNAYGTMLAEDLTTATDPRDLARTLNQLVDTGAKEVVPYQSGLWKAADAHVMATSGGTPPLIQTTADINRLTAPTTLGGQRAQVMADLQRAVGKELEGQAVEQTFGEKSFKRTSETLNGVTVREGESTSVQADARKLRGAETSSGSTTTNDPGTATTPATSETTGGSTTEGTRFDAPLSGRLHTFNPETGTYDEHITLGDAMSLRSAIGSVIGQSRDPSLGLQAADIRVARAWYADLTQRVDDALDTLSPQAKTLYVQARDATAQMYARMRATALLDTMRLAENNAGALDDWFFNNGGLTRMDALRDALHYVDSVPGTTIDGTRWFDLNMQPRIRYQALWRASKSDLGQGDSQPLASLQQAASSRPDIQELIKNKELVELRPGAMSQLQQQLGPEQFNAAMGGQAVAQRFLDLDTALQINARLADPTQHISVQMIQMGGLSKAAAAGGTLALGATGLAHGGIPVPVNIVAGVGTGLTLLLGPAAINYMATDPQLFRSMALGINTGNVSMVTRLASQLLVHALRKEVQDRMRSGQPAQGIRAGMPLTVTPSAAGGSGVGAPPAPGP